MINNEDFFSITHGRVNASEVITLIKMFLHEDSNASYRLIIGTDSHERTDDTHGKQAIQLVTALVVYRKGFGGKYFWKRKMEYNIYSLRQKVYAETMLSLEFATSFVPLLQKALQGSKADYDLEIHVDVGEHGASREMIKEVVGMVKGSGFIAKTKPYSFAASTIADKHT